MLVQKAMPKALASIVSTRASSRAFHLGSQDTAALLDRSNDLTFSTKPAAVTDQRQFLLFPSRKTHTPVIQLEGDQNEGGSALKLDIQSSTIEQNRLHSWFQSVNIPPDQQKPLGDVVTSMWSAWINNDLLRLAVNVGFDKGEMVITDQSALVDDFALYRQPELKIKSEQSNLSSLEKQAQHAGLFYKKKTDGGNIGCYGYGAGVAMSTMDALVEAGGKPANFLDGGGGATDKNVAAALSVLLGDKDIKTIFINSFGGITKTDLIAKGIVKMVRERKALGESVPDMIVRLRGTGEAEAAEILQGATDLANIQVIKDMRSAATAAVKSAQRE